MNKYKYLCLCVIVVISNFSLAEELQHGTKPEPESKEISLTGPSLMLTGIGDKKLYLLVPQDVKNNNAIIEAESIPIKSKSQVYSVKEIFKSTGEWRFTTNSDSGAVFLTLNSNQDSTSIASGEFHVNSSDYYEVQMQVFQGDTGSTGRAVSVTIDGKSKIFGTKGPNTAYSWETWDTSLLQQGDHHITVGTAPGSGGYWEVGLLRLMPINSTCTSSIKDLRIVFGKFDSQQYSNVAPKGLFQTTNMSSPLSYELRRLRKSESSGPCDIVPISIASSSAGQLRIHAIKLLVTTDSKDDIEQKASQFLLVGPGAETSRTVTDTDIEAFFRYLEYLKTRDSTRPDSQSYVTEALQVCSIISKLTSASSVTTGDETTAYCKREIEKLADIEAKWFTYLFGAYSYDWPKPSGFPAGWAKDLIQYRVNLDENRLTIDDGYLDPWGNPYLLKHDSGKVTLLSFGPNGKDDNGQNDDKVAAGECIWK